MTSQLSHAWHGQINGKWRFISKRHSRYAGRVSGAARRGRTFERDFEIWYHRMLGASVKGLSQEYGIHRSTIYRMLEREGQRFANLWARMREPKPRLSFRKRLLRGIVRLSELAKNRVSRELSYQGGMGGDIHEHEISSEDYILMTWVWSWHSCMPFWLSGAIVCPACGKPCPEKYISLEIRAEKAHERWCAGLEL